MHVHQRQTRAFQTRPMADLDGFAGRALTHALASSDSMAGVWTCGTTTSKPSRDFGGHSVGIKAEGDSFSGRRVKSD